jgi:hypothetical protein
MLWHHWCLYIIWEKPIHNCGRNFCNPEVQVELQHMNVCMRQKTCKLEQMRTLGSGSLPSVHLIWVLWAISPKPWAVSVGPLHTDGNRGPYQLHTGITQHFFMATGFPSAQCGNNHHQMWCSIVSIPLPMVHSKNKARIVSLNNRDSCRKIALNVRLVLYNRSILLEASQHTCKWVKDSRLETQKWRSALWLVSNPCWIMHLKDNCDLIFYRALSLPRDKADTPTVLASKDTKRSNGSTMWFSTSQV